MAFSTNGGGNGRGGRRFSRTSGTLSEINIVPLVDVVLVLLIIFMLTAHVMEFGLEIEVPKVKQVKDSAQELPVVNITRAGELYLNDQPVNINQISAELNRRFRGQRSVYVRADKTTPWDPIAQVISTLGEAKIDVRVVTQPIDESGRNRR
jgi:biopolymer transport protein ExbD